MLSTDLAPTIQFYIIGDARRSSSLNLLVTQCYSQSAHQVLQSKCEDNQHCYLAYHSLRFPDIRGSECACEENVPNHREAISESWCGVMHCGSIILRSTAN